MEFKREKRIFLYTLGAIAFAIGLVFMIFEFELFAKSINLVVDAVTPFLIGLIIAFILNLSMNMFENVLLNKLDKFFAKRNAWKHVKRASAIVLSFILIFAFITLLLLFIIPELTESGEMFFLAAYENIPVYIMDFVAFVENLILEYNLAIDIETIEELFYENFSIKNVLDNISSSVPGVFDSVMVTTLSVANGIVSFIMSLIFSIYFLSSKESLIKTFKKLLYSYIPRKTANRISMFLKISNKVFSSYIKGQLTECVILGTLCYIGMSIIGLDYALLISSIVTVSAVVPIFGAFIGAAVGAVLLLIANPMDAIWFLIFFIILQQFEGNVIFPKVVGSSIGLPGVWTLAAVVVFGSLFGILGILIGTPVAAVCYTLIRHNTRQRLKEKEVDEAVLEGSEVNVIYNDILPPSDEQIKEKRKEHKILKMATTLKDKFKKK